MAEGSNEVGKVTSLHQASAEHGAAAAVAICAVHIHRKSLIPLFHRPLGALSDLLNCEPCSHS